MLRFAASTAFFALLCCGDGSTAFVVPDAKRGQAPWAALPSSTPTLATASCPTSPFASRLRSTRTNTGTDAGVDRRERARSPPSFETAFRRAIQQGAAAKAERILLREPQGHVTTYHYTLLLNAWCKSRSPQGPQRADALLDIMKASQHVQPNHVSYTCVIQCWARSPQHQQRYHTSNSHAVARIRTLLAELKEHQLRLGDKDRLISTRTYNTALQVFVMDGQTEQAKDMVQEMFEEHYIHGNDNCKPDTTTFNILLNTWSKASPYTRNAPQRAQATLQRMKEHAKNGNFDTRPDIVTYNTLIDVWARSKQNDAPQKAEEVLRSLQGDGIDAAVRPDIFTYHSVMNAYAKRGNCTKVESLLKEIERPAIQSFNILLHAISRNNRSCKSSPQKASDLLEQIKARNLVPGTITYNTIMNIWSKSGRKDAAERAQALLSEMPLPNVISYSTVLDAWARQPNATAAQDLLEDMIVSDRVKPNVRSFTTVLSAWSRSRLPEAPQRVESLLARMKQYHKERTFPNVKPNELSYTMYIDCLAKSNRTDAAEQAETVLRTMKQKYEAGEKQLKPTVVTYSAVIVAWSRTRNNPNAVPRVEALLEEMKSAQSLSPDVQSINGVLRTIAYSKLPDKLQRTEKVIQWMKESGLRPDHHTKQAVAKYQGILF